MDALTGAAADAGSIPAASMKPPASGLCEGGGGNSCERRGAGGLVVRSLVHIAQLPLQAGLVRRDVDVRGGRDVPRGRGVAASPGYRRSRGRRTSPRCSAPRASCARTSDPWRRRPRAPGTRTISGAPPWGKPASRRSSRTTALAAFALVGSWPFPLRRLDLRVEEVLAPVASEDEELDLLAELRARDGDVLDLAALAADAHPAAAEVEVA